MLVQGLSNVRKSILPTPRRIGVGEPFFSYLNPQTPLKSFCHMTARARRVWLRSYTGDREFNKGGREKKRLLLGAEIYTVPIVPAVQPLRSVPIVGRTRTDVGTSTFPEFRKRGNDRRSPSSVVSCLFFDQESNLSFLRLRRRHELADSGKQCLDIRIVRRDRAF